MLSGWETFFYPVSLPGGAKVWVARDDVFTDPIGSMYGIFTYIWLILPTLAGAYRDELA